MEMAGKEFCLFLRYYRIWTLRALDAALGTSRRLVSRLDITASCLHARSPPSNRPYSCREVHPFRFNFHPSLHHTQALNAFGELASTMSHVAQR